MAELAARLLSTYLFFVFLFLRGVGSIQHWVQSDQKSTLSPNPYLMVTSFIDSS